MACIGRSYEYDFGLALDLVLCIWDFALKEELGEFMAPDWLGRNRQAKNSWKIPAFLYRSFYLIWIE